MTAPRPLIAGNWKMFGLGPSVEEAVKVAQDLAVRPARARVAICAPATLVERLARAVDGSDLIVGGQDNHTAIDGAYTGDVSAEMLYDAGARMVILGHSERRANYADSDVLVAGKTR